MSKYLIIPLLFLFGCSTEEEKKQYDKNFRETGRQFLSVTCINGVKYYRGNRALAPAFNQDGTLKLCNPNKEE